MVKIFIASSTAAKPQARAFIKGCSHAEVAFRPWWEQITAGKTLLEELTRIRNQTDRAVIILSPESGTNLEGCKQRIPNLNVLFEFGFFYGALGAKKVAVVCYGQVHLPSDLGGYIHITGSERFTRCHAAKVSKQTRIEFERWLNNERTELDAIYARLDRTKTDKLPETFGPAN